jgi:hypothetical protein
MSNDGSLPSLRQKVVISLIRKKKFRNDCWQLCNLEIKWKANGTDFYGARSCIFYTKEFCQSIFKVISNDNMFWPLPPPPCGLYLCAAVATIIIKHIHRCCRLWRIVLKKQVNFEFHFLTTDKKIKLDYTYTCFNPCLPVLVCKVYANLQDWFRVSPFIVIAWIVLDEKE